MEEASSCRASRRVAARSSKRVKRGWVAVEGRGEGKKKTTRKGGAETKKKKGTVKDATGIWSELGESACGGTRSDGGWTAPCTGITILTRQARILAFSERAMSVYACAGGLGLPCPLDGGSSLPPNPIVVESGSGKAMDA